MPYIKKEKRAELESLYIHMCNDQLKADGDINYLLFRYCKEHIKPGYNNYKNFCGELRQCATEIERRILAKYEEEKKDENGDV